MVEKSMVEFFKKGVYMDFLFTPILGWPLLGVNLLKKDLPIAVGGPGLMWSLLNTSNPGPAFLEGAVAGITVYALSIITNLALSFITGKANIDFRWETLCNRTVAMIAAVLIGKEIFQVSYADAFLTMTPVFAVVIGTSIQMFRLIHLKKA